MSMIFVMVPSSSATSRGITNWFCFWFCFVVAFFCAPGISSAHAQVFRTVALIIKNKMH